MKTSLSWPVALVALATILGVVTLAGLGKDAAALVTLVTLAINALVYGKVQSIETQTNGNATRQLETIREAMRTLAKTEPAKPDVAPVAPVAPVDTVNTRAWPQLPETD